LRLAATCIRSAYYPRFVACLEESHTSSGADEAKGGG
jgi:hypothetical protein